MWTDGRTDGKTDTTKLIVVFRNFAKATKRQSISGIAKSTVCKRKFKVKLCHFAP